MKSKLAALAITLSTLASGTAFASEGFPQPSFNDAPDLKPQAVTSTRTVLNNFPSSKGAGLGGPTGPATVLLQSETSAPAATNLSTWVAPSFSS